MPSPLLSIFAKAVEGRTCATSRRENDWVFAFGRDASEGCHLVVETRWRVVCEGRIMYGVDDDGQMFGLSTPVNGEERTRSLLGAKTAISASVDPTTADLVIEFEQETRLDIFNLSVAYEAWQAAFRHRDDEITMIGGGGGAISFLRTRIGDHPRVIVGQPLSNW